MPYYRHYTDPLRYGVGASVLSRVLPKLPSTRSPVKFTCKRNNLPTYISPTRTLDPEELLTEKNSGKPVASAIGPVLDYTPPIVDQSLGNWVRGMRKRCLHELKVNRRTMSQFSSFVYNYVQRFQPLPHMDMSHELLDDWLATTKYNAKQKKMYHRELDHYLDKSYNKSRMYNIKSFIKREFYTETKEPRIINAPSEMLKAVVGPYVKQMEHAVYDEHYIKHSTRLETAEKLRRVSEQYSLLYETDYSSFEGTFSLELMQSCELILFKRLLQNNMELYNIIKNVDLGKRMARSRFGNEMGQCEFYGSRLSGCLWTSLGNGFTNQMVIEFIQYKTRKHSKYPVQCDYLVEGDDGLIASTMPLDWDIAGKLGLKLKCKASHDPNELSFCGLCLGPQGLMPGDFRRVIEKFGYSTDRELLNPENQHTPYIKKLRRELLRAKALSLMSYCRACPILQSLAERVIMLTSDVTVTMRHLDWYWDVYMNNLLKEDMTPIPITKQTREFFAKRYGIEPEEQIEIERKIENMPEVEVILEL